MNYADQDEPQMVVMVDAVKIFPFATLPFLYVVQHIFSSPVAAASIVALFELLSMVMLPFLVSKLRTAEELQIKILMQDADDIAFVCRMLPSCAFGQIVMFNTEYVSWLSDKFFPWPVPKAPTPAVPSLNFDPDAEIEEVEAPPPEPSFEELVSSYPTDPWHSKNAGGDYRALMYAVLAWWVILLLMVDRRGTRHGICCYR